MPPKTKKKKICDFDKQPTCIECPCGSTYQNKGLGQDNHFKTKTHKDFMANDYSVWKKNNPDEDKKWQQAREERVEPEQKSKQNKQNKTKKNPSILNLNPIPVEPGPTGVQTAINNTLFESEKKMTEIKKGKKVTIKAISCPIEGEKTFYTPAYQAKKIKEFNAIGKKRIINRKYLCEIFHIFSKKAKLSVS